MSQQSEQPTPEEILGAEDTIQGAEAEEAADLAPDERVAALEAEVRKLKEDYLRALADGQNAKRMADKRIEDNSKYAVSNFAKELLSVADNMSRALLAATPEARKNEQFNTLSVGIEMTEKELSSALGKYGVRKIDSLMQPFDPNFHQAVQEVEKTDVPTGTVVQVFQDAYVIAERLLRPAMVVVSRGGPKREEVAVSQGDTTSVDQSV
jgi:molecular chaperone GrpE